MPNWFSKQVPFGPLVPKAKILQDAAMSEPNLLRLHLASALCYEAFAVEIDPFSGIPSGSDCVWMFDPYELISEAEGSGPRLKAPLPQAIFSGAAIARREEARDKAESCSGESSRSAWAGVTCLPPGDYLFVQWRKTSYPRIEDGFEEFMRQVWWEAEKTEGPWILRIVAEDNDMAYQGLRLISKS